MKLVKYFSSRVIREIQFNNSSPMPLGYIPEFGHWNSKFNSFNVLDFEQYLPPDVQIRILKSRINKLVDRL